MTSRQPATKGTRMGEISIGRTEVYLRWIYERRGIAMLTKAARSDFEAYAVQQANLDQQPKISIYDVKATTHAE